MPGSRKALPAAGAGSGEPVAGFGYNDLLEELAADLLLPDLDADEVTATMLGRYAKIHRNVAKGILDRKVRDGLMTSREVRHEGHRVTAYRKVID